MFTAWFLQWRGFDATAIVGPALSDAQGWDAPQYFATLQLVGRAMPKAPIKPPARDGGEPDAALAPGQDAATPADGDGALSADAGKPASDAGYAGLDSGRATSVDSGSAAEVSGGCGCGASARSPASLALACLGALFLRRRRPRA